MAGHLSVSCGGGMVWSNDRGSWGHKWNWRQEIRFDDSIKMRDGNEKWAQGSDLGHAENLSNRSKKHVLNR